MGFMARLLALCSLPRTNPKQRNQYVRRNGPYALAFARAASRIAFMRFGIRDIRQILNPLRDILHALHRGVLQRESPRPTQKYRAVG